MRFNQQQAKPALRLTQCAPPNWPVSSEPKHTHCANPHSNNRSTQTNPAISRLSASPTTGNVPRHPNLARRVRETYTIAAVHDHLKMLRCSPSLRTFVHHAAFVGWNVGFLLKKPCSSHRFRQREVEVFQLPTSRASRHREAPVQLRRLHTLIA